MPFFRKIIAWFLLAIFFIAGTPDDLWHSLTHHEDTHDSTATTASLGIRHIHCSALQLSLPAFSANDLLALPAKEVALTGQIFLFPSLQTSAPFISKKGRAPPVLA